MILSLASSLGDRVRTGDLVPPATIANSAVATATLKRRCSPTGSYTLEVTALATAQSADQPCLLPAPTSPVGSGT